MTEEICVEEIKKEINRNTFDRIYKFGYKKAMVKILEEMIEFCEKFKPKSEICAKCGMLKTSHPTRYCEKFEPKKEMTSEICAECGIHKELHPVSGVFYGKPKETCEKFKAKEKKK